MAEAFRVAIPARYGSSRLPGKPLRRLAGRTLLEHVHRVARASGAAEVVVATDDERIRAEAERFGAEVCMTAADHASGTDRLAEVVRRRGWPDQTVVVNLQGAEPLLPPQLLQQAAATLQAHPQAGIATLCTPIRDPDELFDPHLVKVVCDGTGRALYFSRAPLPWHREAFAAGRPAVLPPGVWWRHIGVYAYRAVTLRAFPALPPGPLEPVEALEQLRALHNGVPVQVSAIEQAPPAGVDTEADLARVEALLRQAEDGS
ncbi:MAG: 3-deoxy-manno-octulosonate cytidylyltransferase [Candidatus Competibacterales bacterium]|nr:3-deoxy-manno-octulosonate cytidylyltransferase [Candidatus Competibacterales bacterium]